MAKGRVFHRLVREGHVCPANASALPLWKASLSISPPPRGFHPASRAELSAGQWRMKGILLCPARVLSPISDMDGCDSVILNPDSGFPRSRIVFATAQRTPRFYFHRGMKMDNEPTRYTVYGPLYTMYVSPFTAKERREALTRPKAARVDPRFPLAEADLVGRLPSCPDRMSVRRGFKSPPHPRLDGLRFPAVWGGGRARL